MADFMLKRVSATPENYCDAVKNSRLYDALKTWMSQSLTDTTTFDGLSLINMM